MNGTVTPQHGGDGRDGAVEEEHAARQKPRTNAVKSRVMIVSFCDRNEDLESILGSALTLKVDPTPATLSPRVTTWSCPRSVLKFSGDPIDVLRDVLH
jgi:hypothetical protein